MHYSKYTTKISLLNKVYATFYTGLEIRNLNGTKHFRKSNMEREEGSVGVREEEREGKKDEKIYGGIIITTTATEQRIFSPT